MASDRFVYGAPLGRWQTNCFVVGDRARGEAVVIDPGEGGVEFVSAALDELGVGCQAVLLTHGHLDHLWAAPELAEALDVPVFLHPDDRWLWDDPGAGIGLPDGTLEQLLGRAWSPPTERLQDLRDDQRLGLAGVELVARHTPGHTPGHVTFLGRELADAEIRFGRHADAGEPGVLFSGDLLFQGSVGRTDFPRGSADQLLDAIARTVLPLEDDTLVLTGHGPATSVGAERRHNPFLARLRDGAGGGGRRSLWVPEGRRT